VLIWIRFKCQNCNVGLCSDHCLRVFHAKLQFLDQHHTMRNRLCNCKYHFSLGPDIFLNTNVLFNKSKGVWTL
jgi:hypothetical protein